MGTQQMSVERLSSGVVKLCWSWHGKMFSFVFRVIHVVFCFFALMQPDTDLLQTIAVWRTQCWVMLLREFQTKKKMKENLKTPLWTAQKILMVGKQSLLNITKHFHFFFFF